MQYVLSAGTEPRCVGTMAVGVLPEVRQLDCGLTDSTDVSCANINGWGGSSIISTIVVRHNSVLLNVGVTKMW